MKIDWHVLAPRVNLLQQILKGKLNLEVCQTACLHKFHIGVLCAQLLRLLLGYLSSPRIFIDKIYFVANQHDLDFLLGRIHK